MKYYVYGINRVSKDFIYIFKEYIEIIGIIADNDEKRESIFGCKVFQLEDIILADDKIIVCGIDKEDKIHKLKQFGYEYEKQYIFEEDLFYLLDDFDIPKGKKIIVWGAGKKGKEFLRENSSYNIEFVVDSNSKQDDFLGYNIVKPEEIMDWSRYYVIIAVMRSREIREYLEKKGLVEKKDFLQIQQLIGKPSDLLRKTIFDTNSYNFECNTMHNHLECLGEGDTCCCCTTFLDIHIGNIIDDGVLKVWNSITHKILCLSTENRTYTFCKKSMCPFFIEKGTNSFYDLEREYKIMDENPKVLALGYDYTCNLKCKTCRDDFRVADGEKKEKIFELSKLIEDDILDKCDFLIAAGDGEVLLSKAYEKIYMSEKAKDIKLIRLLSNGLLFNEKKWNNIKKGKNGKILLTVSIDAAKASTYRKIRCGGDFETLKKNMEYASFLRRNNELAYFRINFVVQKNNYQEMADFVQWGIDLGCDEVFFTKILNWGTFSEQEFKEISMMEEDGMTPKKELKEVLKNPIFSNPIVDLGTIQFSHKPVRENIIDNYYIWEMNRKLG